jgi:NADPH:quinone reductase-like Zn-dependent oxidoreductase
MHIQATEIITGMKAIVCTKYGPPEVLQLREVIKPLPADDEILIKIHATTVTVADYRVRSFTIPPSFWIPARLMLGLRRPRKAILGAELSGEVESTGKDVTLFKKGDEIFAATLMNFGAYAEFTCLPQAGAVSLKPANISYEEAAAIPIGARTALHFLRKVNIRPGQKILIYGASGSVGTYAVQLASYFGARVTGVCSTSNLDLVRSLGAEKVIDYTEEGFTKKFETYDIIFIAVDKLSFADSIKVLSKNGTYINITAPVKSFPMIWTSMTGGRRIITGENSPETAEALVFLKNLVEEGRLRVVVDRQYPLEQIVEAHRYVDKGHKKGNVVIKV